METNRKRLKYYLENSIENIYFEGGIKRIHNKYLGFTSSCNRLLCCQKLIGNTRIHLTEMPQCSPLYSYTCKVLLGNLFSQFSIISMLHNCHWFCIVNRLIGLLFSWSTLLLMMCTWVHIIIDYNVLRSVLMVRKNVNNL